MCLVCRHNYSGVQGHLPYHWRGTHHRSFFTMLLGVVAIALPVTGVRSTFNATYNGMLKASTGEGALYDDDDLYAASAATSGIPGFEWLLYYCKSSTSQRPDHCTRVPTGDSEARRTTKHEELGSMASSDVPMPVPRAPLRRTIPTKLMSSSNHCLQTVEIVITSMS